MQFTDAVAAGDWTVDASGYLKAFARTARTGVQTYLGSEMGRPDLETVNVYRDEAEVFSKASLDSFSQIPITVDHPSAPMTSETWKAHAVGTTGDEVLRDGEYLRIGVKIKANDAVASVKSGKRELSVGYSTDIDWTPGIAPDGTHYQARQTKIVADHIAIVSRGRAGSKARIGDDAKNSRTDGTTWGASPLTDTAINKEIAMSDTLRTVMVDGLQVKTTDEGAAAISKLTTALADKATEATLASDLHDTALAAKDAELATKDGEIADLTAKVLDAAAIDKLVADRATLIDTAKRLAKDVKPEGLSDADIRKAVVTAVRGADAITGKSDAYVDAAFDVLADAKPADPLKAALGKGIQSNDADNVVWSADAFTLSGVPMKKEA